MKPPRAVGREEKKATERIERSRLYNDCGIIDIIVTSVDETGRKRDLCRI